jgi:hypothetical protein
MVYCCFTNISNIDVVMMIQWNLVIHYDFIGWIHYDLIRFVVIS